MLLLESTEQVTNKLFAMFGEAIVYFQNYFVCLVNPLPARPTKVAVFCIRLYN